MKQILTTALVVILLYALTISVSGHGGKTDGSGGHYDNSSGEYHYHHGYPAHDHIDGKCQYDFVDKTDHSNGSSSKNTTLITVGKKDSVFQIISLIFYIIILAIPFMFFIIYPLCLVTIGSLVELVKSENVQKALSVMLLIFSCALSLFISYLIMK